MARVNSWAWKIVDLMAYLEDRGKSALASRLKSKAFAVIFFITGPQLAYAIDASPSLSLVQEAIDTKEWARALSGLEAAKLAVWDELPLSARNATIVSAPATGFGQYTKRGSNVFRQNETVFLYAELQGYNHRRRGHAYVFGVTADFELLSMDGRLLGAREAFWVRNLESLRQNLEFHVDLTYSFRGLPPGAYIIATRFRDNHSEKTFTLETPIVIE